MIIGDNISQRKTQSIIPSLPGVTMTEFFLQYFHSIKKTGNEEKRKIPSKRLLVNPIPNSPDIHHKNCIEVRRIINKILGVKG